jgi:hypothetical protein
VASAFAVDLEMAAGKLYVSNTSSDAVSVLGVALKAIALGPEPNPGSPFPDLILPS